jgi:hypothetical protein
MKVTSSVKIKYIDKNFDPKEKIQHKIKLVRDAVTINNTITDATENAQHTREVGGFR